MFLLHPGLVQRFHILFSVWTDFLMKRHSQVSERQTRYFSDGSCPSPATLQSHASEGTFLLAPAHSNLRLLSTRFAFPVLTLVLAQIISCLVRLPGLHVC